MEAVHTRIMHFLYCCSPQNCPGYNNEDYLINQNMSFNEKGRCRATWWKHKLETALLPFEHILQYAVGVRVFQLLQYI